MTDLRFEAIIRTPWGGPWRRFHSPTRLILATNPDEVVESLAHADAALQDGFYVAGFVTYEAAAAFELPILHASGSLPLVCFGVFDASHVETLRHFPASGDARAGEWHPSIDRDAYTSAIRSIRQRIEAGDTYQINYTFRLRTRFDGSPTRLMQDLVDGQAGEWSAYIDIGSHAICSASPELFFRLEAGRIECRPMKGTAPRGYWPVQDEANGAALRASEKNRAENVMIVDMVRNDLGRIAAIGTVKTSALFEVSRFPHQWQMTSTVEAEANVTSLSAIFEAMFPSGSITGAPKHSAMGIIGDLETTPRGIYTGAIGYASPRGRAHFNVAIRTVVVDRASGTAEMGIGSGVVWDSVDADEYDECLLKAAPVGRSSTEGRAHASYVVRHPPEFQLLETLLWTPGEGFVLLERHLARMAASAGCFGFVIDEPTIRSMLTTATLDLRGAAKVRLRLEADGSVLCEAVDLTALNSPFRTGLAATPVDPRDTLLYHKTTKRTVYDRARAERPDVDAPILWNTRGEITEATESNVVIERDGRRMTPPVACGLLPGTMRAELLARGDLQEAEITKADLLQADRIWLINSVRGWIEATLVDHP